MPLDEAPASQPSPTPLRALLGSTPLEQRRALLLIRQVLEALETLHAGDKTHGNITPDTIEVTTRLGNDTVTLVQAGGKTRDPVYAAPETTVGQVDPRADLYALGAVLFETLTGRPPFAADDVAALRRMHVYAPVQTLKQRVPEQAFPEELEAIIARALAKKRESRYRTAAEMLAPIDRVLDTLEKAALPPPADPGKGLDESLLLLAKDLQAPPVARPSEPMVQADNVSRQVPQLPLPTRAWEPVRRRLSGLSPQRRKLLLGIAAGVGLLLVVAIVTCGGGGGGSKKSAPVAATNKPAAAKPVDLPTQCERLGYACGDTAKHITAVIEQCKRGAADLATKKCVAQANKLYECYQAKVCGKDAKIWALEDLRVLAQRHHACAAEATALQTCAGGH
jgi:serine/threonine-protein kinase